MPELAIIFSGIIVGLIVIGISVNGIVSKVLDYKRSLRAEQPDQLTNRTTELSARTDMIEDRVRVLERIATDNSPDLATQIEQLRDSNIPHQAEVGRNA